MGHSDIKIFPNISKSEHSEKYPFYLILKATITCLKMNFINIAILSSMDSQEMHYSRRQLSLPHLSTQMAILNTIISPCSSVTITPHFHFKCSLWVNGVLRQNRSNLFIPMELKYEERQWKTVQLMTRVTSSLSESQTVHLGHSDAISKEMIFASLMKSTERVFLISG